MSHTDLNLVEEYDLANGEKGIRARVDIAEGAIIGIYDGELKAFRLKEGRIVDNGEHKYIVQVAVSGETLYGLVSHPDAPFYGIDFINHGCEPNVAARDRVVLVTIQPVRAGDRLVIDYRTWDLVPEGVSCWCTPSRCQI